jgi:hypothetical protein
MNLALFERILKPHLGAKDNYLILLSMAEDADEKNGTSCIIELFEFCITL